MESPSQPAGHRPGPRPDDTGDEGAGTGGFKKRPSPEGPAASRLPPRLPTGPGHHGPGPPPTAATSQPHSLTGPFRPGKKPVSLTALTGCETGRPGSGPPFRAGPDLTRSLAPPRSRHAEGSGTVRNDSWHHRISIPERSQGFRTLPGFRNSPDRNPGRVRSPPPCRSAGDRDNTRRRQALGDPIGNITVPPLPHSLTTPPPSGKSL